MIEAYPLCWPHDYSRTPTNKIRNSRFRTTLGAARDYVKAEIKRLDGKDPIISTNIPLKQDGDLRADWSRARIDDHGASVYFMRNKVQVCLCCDTYSKVWENLHAIGRTIEALRQIDRDGVSDFLNRTFTGFKALPESVVLNQKSIWEILGLTVKPGSIDAIHLAYKQKAKQLHPDLGGSAESFQELQTAYKQAKSHYQDF
jgi:hypothetical protein